MKRRVKVGDIEIGFMPNPAPEKRNYLVYRFRPRTREYLSKQEATLLSEAEYLFTQFVGQEQLRQKQEAERAASGLAHFIEPGSVAPIEGALYNTHPLFARF